MVISTLSGIIVIAVVVQLLKSFYEAFGLAPTSRFHDPCVWLTAFGSGVGGYIMVAAVNGPLTGPDTLSAAGQGLLAAFSAVATYSLVTHPYFTEQGTPSSTKDMLVGATLVAAPAPPRIDYAALVTELAPQIEQALVHAGPRVDMTDLQGLADQLHRAVKTAAAAPETTVLVDPLIRVPDGTASPLAGSTYTQNLGNLKISMESGNATDLHTVSAPPVTLVLQHAAEG